MTNHGLNLLTYYYMDQADNLANEMEENILNSNPHYEFMQAVRAPLSACTFTLVQTDASTCTWTVRLVNECAHIHEDAFLSPETKLQCALASAVV